MKKIAFLAVILFIAGIFGVGMTASAQSAASENTPVKVFIHFADTPGQSERGLVRAFGGKITHSYTIIPAVAAEIPENSIEGLLRNPNIVAIEEDHKVEALGITYDPEYSNAWGVERIESGVAHENSNKGTGVKIGIIDSGINYDHPDLAPNYRGGYDFYYYDNDPMDVYGHGTHVAGTACAADNDNGSANPKLGVVGVAPNCDLYSLRVLGDNGSGYESDIVYAIQWALGDSIDLYWNGVYQDSVAGERLDVVNLSLGSSQAYSLASELTFARAADEGLIIVAAAGNSGNRAGKGTNTIYPANYDSVIAVGATNSSDKRASFSSTGPNVELTAPGESVYSTWNDNQGHYDPQPVCRGTLEDINGDGQPDGECYKYGSGTSMASPHVAGVAALIISSGLVSDTNGNGRINDEVRALMDSTAIDLGASGRDDKYGFGLVNVNNALSAVTPIAVGTLDGFVRDASSNPIAGAAITAGPYSTATDATGYYVINDIKVGNYTVAANAAGYTEDSIGVSISENTVTSADFVLIEAPVQDIILAVSVYKIKGVQHADLTWTTDNTGLIEIWRDGLIVATTADDGAYTDNIGNKGGGSYSYQVCEQGTSNCSLVETVSF